MIFTHGLAPGSLPEKLFRTNHSKNHRNKLTGSFDSKEAKFRKSQIANIQTCLFIYNTYIADNSQE